MKSMIRSFASALVAVMTLGLVQTAQAEVFYIGDPVVHPEKACEVKGCPSEAEEASRVEFTLSNFAQGVQLDSVKVVPTYWYEPFEASYDYDKECFYFDMPNDNVYIEVYCSAAPEPGTDYSITIPTFKGGSVTSDVPSAQEGAPVKLTVTPDKGYELASIVVVGDGVTIEPEGAGSTYTFTMPPSAVEVQATFKEKLYNINIPEFKGGTVTSNVASTNEGATVTLTVTPDKGYVLDTITVGGIQPEKGEGSTYTFEMPASDVAVQATFKAAATKHTIGWDVENQGCVVNPSVTEEVAGNPVAFTLSDFAEGFNVGGIAVHDPEWAYGYIEPTWDDSMQAYTFAMPDYDVIISVFAATAPAAEYNITTVADPEGTCLFTVYPGEMEASEGDWVDFRFNLADGANFVSLTVYNTDDPTQTISEEDIGTYVDENGVEWHYFEMPDYDVTIKVTTESGEAPATAHKISTSVTPSDACEVHAQESAQSGEEVYFEVGNFAAGATLGSLTVWNMSAGEQVKCEQTGKGYIFTMPDGDVLIEVVCSDPEPPTTVEVMPLARSYTSEIGAYTNGVLLTATPESTYIVNSNATVDVVFESNTSKGRYFKVNGVYTSIVTNTITASTDPYQFLGPLPDTGKKVGDSAYAFVDGDTCTIVGSGAADTRLSTVVSPGAITSAVIQPGITEIGARFFKGFKWLNTVTGGQDLATVGTNAFYACFSLVTIDLDCTAVPTGLDGAVVYQNALKPDGTIYQIPNIKVKNHVTTLYGKENLDDDWESLGPAEGAIIYDQGIYRFFQTRLVPDTGNKE